MANKLLFVTDFDGTLTKFDTTNISFKSCQKYLDGSVEEKAELEEFHKERGSKYLNGYSECFEKGLKQFGSDVSSNQKSLMDFVVSLDAYNRNSRITVAKNHLLDDILDDKEIIRKFCEEICYQEQALETLCWLQKESTKMANNKVASCKVLSVNWFKPVLVECLEGIIDANDIVTALPPILAKDGTLDLGLASSSIDKLDWIKKWKIDVGGDGDQCLCVYVGDSMTDLLALLEAEVGILVGKNRHVLETVKIFELDFQPMDQAASLVANNGELKLNKKNNRLFYADSWSEIQTFLKTFSYSKS